MTDQKKARGLTFAGALLIFFIAAALRLIYAALIALVPPAGDEYFDKTAAAVRQEAATLRQFASPAVAGAALRAVAALAAVAGGGKDSGLLRGRGWARLNAMKPSVLVTMQHILLRIFAVLCTLPLALLAVVIGVTQGMTTRARRRYRAEKESAFIYQHAQSLIWLPLSAFFIYLCVPVALPFYTFAVIAWCVFGVTIWIHTGWFTKHL